MVVLAPWSSLILPSGRTKPLVRGEENPAAWPQEWSWGEATAVRPIAEGVACPYDCDSSVLGVGSREIPRRQKYRPPSYGRVPCSEQGVRSNFVAGRNRAWVGYVVCVLPGVALPVSG